MIKLSEHTPVLYEEDNFSQSTNGDQILAYRIVLPEAFSLSPIQYDEIHAIWLQALKKLPRCILLKQDIYTTRKFTGKNMPESTFLQKASKKNAIGKSYVSHISNLFFINAGNRYLKNSHISNPFRKPPSEKDIQTQIKQDDDFKEQIKGAITFLKNSPYFTVVPHKTGYANSLAKLYFNGLYSNHTTDTRRINDKMYIGDKRVGAFAITANKQLSENISTCVVDGNASGPEFKFYRGMFDALGLELPFDHVFNQVLFFDNHGDLKADIQDKQAWFHRVRQFAPENEKSDTDISDYLKEMAGDEKIRLVRAHFNVTFFAEDENTFQSYKSQLNQKFKEVDVTPYYPVGNNLANIVNHSFFTNVSGLNSPNAFVIDLQQALCMLTNVSGFRQDKEGIFFSDRVFNLPTLKDVWDAAKRYIKARNFFIVAPTGEGKSVLANTIFSQLLDQGYYIVINDLGGSYEKLALLYPEITLYLQYVPGQPIGVNPFYVEANSVPDIIKVNELVEFVRTLYLRDDQYKEKEKVSMRKLIQFYYKTVHENHSFPNFYYFVQFLHQEGKLLTELELDDDLFNAKNFIHICSEFVGDGSYAFLFPEDAKELDIDLTGKRLVINEFDKAQDDPLLISILLNLSNAIDRKLIWEDKTKRGYIFYDECAKQMKFPNVLNTLEWKAQAIRKQEGGLGIVLQSPNQIPKNSTAESIIDNIKIFYILNNSAGYEDIVERFKFTEHEHNLLKSITNNFAADADVKYSEFLFKRAKHSNILRLHLAEEVRCAYLTEGSEHMKIMEFYKKSNNMETAITDYIESRKKIAS